MKPIFYILVASLLTFWGATSVVYAKEAPGNTLQLLTVGGSIKPTLYLASPTTYSSDLPNTLTHKTDLASLPIEVLIQKDTALSLEWSSNIEYLKNLKSDVILSLIPSKELTDEQYIQVCESLYDKIERAKASNIHLVWYPKTAEALALYNTPKVWGIGTVMTDSKDLSLLDGAYTLFKDKKSLFVKDAIFQNSTYKKGETLTVLNELYYALAVKYPEVVMAFSPYNEIQEDNSLKAFYNSLLAEGWITSLNEKTSFADLTALTPSAFHVPEKYSMVSSQNSFLLDFTLGDGSLLGDRSAINCVEYSLNGKIMANAFVYPYQTSISPKDFYNGIARLNVKAFDSAGKLLAEASYDITLVGAEVKSKAPRTTQNYSMGQKPIYKGDYFPVLMYHVFSENVKPSEQFITVDVKLFDEQIKMLLEKGYTPVTFYDLDLYFKGEGGLPEKPILITADDGYLDNYTLAFPVLQKYNIPATFFVPPATVGVNTGNLHFEWGQAKEMEESGLVDIQVHGLDHTPFLRLSLDDIRYQVSAAKGLIEKHLGARDVVAVSYPEFRHNDQHQALLTEMGVAFQTTDNAKKGTPLLREDVKRINVPNSMTPEKLIAIIESLTK